MLIMNHIKPLLYFFIVLLFIDKFIIIFLFIYFHKLQIFSKTPEVKAPEDKNTTMIFFMEEILEELKCMKKLITSSQEPDHQPEVNIPDAPDEKINKLEEIISLFNSKKAMEESFMYKLDENFFCLSLDSSSPVKFKKFSGGSFIAYKEHHNIYCFPNFKVQHFNYNFRDCFQVEGSGFPEKTELIEVLSPGILEEKKDSYYYLKVPCTIKIHKLPYRK